MLLPIFPSAQPAHTHMVRDHSDLFASEVGGVGNANRVRSLLEHAFHSAGSIVPLRPFRDNNVSGPSFRAVFFCKDLFGNDEDFEPARKTKGRLVLLPDFNGSLVLNWACA